MNPTFLKDEKINNAFNTEQELLKSLKKDTKNDNDIIPKDDMNLNFNNFFQFNFNYYFFDRQSQDEEGEYTGNYEDYQYKSIIDNLNSENPLSTEEQNSDIVNNNYNYNNNINKEEDDDKNKNDNNNSELINQNKFNYNFINFNNNS